MKRFLNLPPWQSVGIFAGIVFGIYLVLAITVQARGGSQSSLASVAGIAAWAVLAVALSFSIAGISGLFLGLSPIGINVTSITEALSGIVIVLAILTFLRKTGLIKLQMRKLRAQKPMQVTS